MLPSRVARPRRRPLLRPLRPPNAPHRVPIPRLFTQNSQLLLLAPRSVRPQLPYLTQPAVRGPFQKQISRLLSTESKKFVRDTAILTSKAVVIALFISFCISSITFGFKTEAAERRKPTPDDWRFRTRYYMRYARKYEDTDVSGLAYVDWARVGTNMRRCLYRLENPEFDGEGVVELDDGGRKSMVDGPGRAGLDISAKSYQWRAGYFEACMTCARAAEHLDNWIVDITRKMTFPKEVVIGPSNPDPRPTPPYMRAAPLEENCLPAFGPPQWYYMRVLTGVGFTTRQRMEAATAYATYLESKNLKESAEEMYKWAVDISKSALPVSADTVMDLQTGVLKEHATGHVSPNLLRASTNLAVFYARNGNISTAMPMLLSVLRARRTAQVVPSARSDEFLDNAEQDDAKNVGSIFKYIKGLMVPPKFPPPPPSGDDPFIREAERPSCDESELMLYIGEILFATRPQSNEGLAWTRQSVTIADASLDRLENKSRPSKQAAQSIIAHLMPETPPPEKVGEIERCKDCLFAGVQNWEAMLQRLIERRAVGNLGATSGWLSWLPGFQSTERTSEELDAELAQVAGLKDKILKEGIAKEMIKVGGHTGGTWLG